MLLFFSAAWTPWCTASCPRTFARVSRVTWVPAVVEDFPPARYRLAIDWQPARYFVGIPLASLVAITQLTSLVSIRSLIWWWQSACQLGGNQLASLVAICSPAWWQSARHMVAIRSPSSVARQLARQLGGNLSVILAAIRSPILWHSARHTVEIFSPSSRWQPARQLGGNTYVRLVATLTPAWWQPAASLAVTICHFGGNPLASLVAIRPPIWWHSACQPSIYPATSLATARRC